jgi:2-polyprenyl-6-methoxyphenol hydroxylase-like FAD-dependent oxidoreductase
MTGWSKGRVALVGDAAFGPSLLAGEGAALGMLGAYVLAGELADARGDHERAFRSYERRLKPFMDGKQRAALRMAGWFTPRSPFALFLRDQLTRVAGLPGVGRMMLGPMIADSITLPDYRWGAEPAAPIT